MKSYCRLCLEASDNYESIDDTRIITHRRKIEMFIPEVAIDSIKSSVLCTKCTNILQNIYELKLKCLKTEETINNYVQDNNITGQIDIEKVIENLNRTINVNCIEYLEITKAPEVCEDTTDNKNVKKIKTEISLPTIEIKQESHQEITFEISADGVYKCHICKETYPTFTTLQNHLKTHVPCSECTLCGKVFKRRHYLQCHLANMHGCVNKNGQHKCMQCEDIYYTIYALRLHIASVHVNVTNLEKPKCEECNKVFKFEYSLQRHRTTHNLNCHKCKMRCLTRIELIRHMADVHTCTVNTNKQSALIGHKKSHTEKNCRCIICGKKYATKLLLKRHFRYHTERNKFQCEHCQAKFSMKSHLTEHIRRHTGEKPYKCDKCNKAFSQSSTLLTHTQNIHLEVKRYFCHICQARFLYKSTFNIHVQKHNNVVEKKHVCDICGSAFSLVSKLRLHKLRHSDIKNYRCEKCGMGFVDMQGLRRHIITHTGEKPYQCHHCGFKCNRKSNLTVHINSHLKKKRTDNCNYETVTK